jgi:hypothetical protein
LLGKQNFLNVFPRSKKWFYDVLWLRKLEKGGILPALGQTHVLHFSLNRDFKPPPHSSICLANTIRQPLRQHTLALGLIANSKFQQKKP